MEQDTSDNILAFDTLFTTNHMQILKSLMPYMESDMQKELAVYIKFSELQYTISYFHKRRAKLCGCSFDKKEFDLPSVYRVIKGYCTSAEQRQIEQLIRMMNTMETVRNMQEMVEFMQEMEAFTGAGDASSDSGENSQSNDGFNAFDMLKGMLSPEQAELFEMMQTQQSK